MVHTRLLILLIVMSSVVATRQPMATAAARDITAAEPRSAWINRVRVSSTQTITRAALLHRQTLHQPVRATTSVIVRIERTPLWQRPALGRFCLPPPAVC